MATGLEKSGILSFETDAKWPRPWKQQQRPCTNPGCEILTEAADGVCGMCNALKRADETYKRIKAGEEIDMPIFFMRKRRGRWSYV